MYFSDFSKWGKQTEGGYVATPEEQKYLDDLPPRRHGKWAVNEYFKEKKT